jgi:VWFA-related protein
VKEKGLLPHARPVGRGISAEILVFSKISDDGNKPPASRSDLVCAHASTYARRHLEYSILIIAARTEAIATPRMKVGIEIDFAYAFQRNVCFVLRRRDLTARACFVLSTQKTISTASQKSMRLATVSGQRAALRAAVIICQMLLLGYSEPLLSQNQTPSETDEIVRVNANLVQTGVIVLDKEGRPVNDLPRELFELYVDGKLKPISFFESSAIGAGRGAIESKSNAGKPPPAQLPPDVISRDRGRTVLFFVDDQHLSHDSTLRTQNSILHFIDGLMEANDRVAIISASGQIGFLQQLTTNKAVLRAAVKNFSPIPSKTRDTENPPMGEYAAMQITVQHDRDLFNYYVDQTMKVNRMEESERPIAAAMVESRARIITQQSDANNKNTLLSLMGLIRSVENLPGRKLVFYLSDGFVMNLFGSDVSELMGRLSDAAVRANVVIYSIDSRGLFVDSQFEASVGGGADTKGVLGRALSSEHSFSQEGLYALAADTGGRAQLNSNSIDNAISTGLRETSVYYVLAWKPDTSETGEVKFRHIAVKITGRPELRVFLQKGYFAGPIKPVAQPLAGVTASLNLAKHLPLRITLGFGQASGNRMTITLAMEIERQLRREDTSEPDDLNMEFLGVVVDTRGKTVASFARRVDVPRSQPQTPPTLNYFLRVDPGLYQVRVAVVDSKHKNLGEATDWIEVPAIPAGTFSLSSIYVDEAQNHEAASRPREMNFRRLSRFTAGSRFILTTYIYNASHKGDDDLSIEIKILRGGQVVSTASGLHVKTSKATDQNSIPFSAEVALKTLPPGSYVLQLSATDRQTKARASQEMEFAILPASE